MPRNRQWFQKWQDRRTIPEIAIAPIMLVSRVLIGNHVASPLPAVGSAESRRRKKWPQVIPIALMK